MSMKIVGCLICVIVLNCNGYFCSDIERRVERRVEPRHVEISKNITVHRNRYGRHMGLLAQLKSFRHRKHIHHTPYVVSKLWRASFEYKIQPHAISEREISSSTFSPTQFGGNNSGAGSNSIESIFDFGNTDQQSIVTIGGSNQIVNGPDERDEIPIVENHQDQVVHKDAIHSVIPMPPTEVEEKSERVLRHAVQPRTEEQSKEDEIIDVTSTTPIIDNQETVETTVLSFTIPQTTVATQTSTETDTPMKPESSSTASSTEHVPVSTTPLPTEWLGYYDIGLHKPEFIQGIEFTTAYPSQLVSEDIRYFTYGRPFKPSLPDFTNDEYSSHFFVPLRYFKR